RTGDRLRGPHVVTGHTADVPVGQRIEGKVIEDRVGNPADPTGWNLIPGKRHTRLRVADGRARARQIAVPPGVRRDRNRLEARRVEPRALVVPEEEQPVLRDRPAERAAVDILPAIWLRRPGAVIRPGIRIHLAVAVELEGVSVKIIRAGLDDVAD